MDYLPICIVEKSGALLYYCNKALFLYKGEISIMGERHDSYATHFGDTILHNIRNGNPKFKQIFSTNIRRSADWDWPRPDYVCFDEDLRCSYAMEFKPPGQNKREYLTGLGQSYSYLQKHSYAGLIIPYVADDGFPIAQFILDIMESPEFINISSSLYAYDPSNGAIELLKPITRPRTDIPTSRVAAEAKTFWCWWRDISQYELYDLLNLSFIYNEYQGDIYTNYIYPDFYNKMIKKETMQWDGTSRNKTYSEQSYASEKQNYKIPLSQLELWNNGDCRLTNLGYKMLEIGHTYGTNSQRFIDALAYIVLTNGRHLDLINIVNRFQNGTMPQKSTDYLLQIENYLTSNGCIGKRKPTAITTNAKGSYLRDEPKLWNKLGLLIPYDKRSYFIPNKGYEFNWERITNILVNGDPFKQ